MTPSQSISCQLDDNEKLALQLVAQWYEFPSVAQLVRYSLEEICGPAWLKATECVKNGEYTRPEKHPGRPPKHTRIPNA